MLYTYYTYIIHILYIYYTYRHQNVIVCSPANCQPSLKISCKSPQKFLRKVANRETNNDDYDVILLGGGNWLNCTRLDRIADKCLGTQDLEMEIFLVSPYLIIGLYRLSTELNCITKEKVISICGFRICVGLCLNPCSAFLIDLTLGQHLQILDERGGYMCKCGIFDTKPAIAYLWNKAVYSQSYHTVSIETHVRPID